MTTQGLKARIALGVTLAAVLASTAQAGNTAAPSGAKTEATGFLAINSYQMERYAQQHVAPALLAQLAARSEAKGYQAINEYLMSREAVLPATSSGGFRWQDAGIGSAFTAGVLLVVAAVGLILWRRTGSTAVAS